MSNLYLLTLVFALGNGCSRRKRHMHHDKWDCGLKLVLDFFSNISFYSSISQLCVLKTGPHDGAILLMLLRKMPSWPNQGETSWIRIELANIVLLHLLILSVSKITMIFFEARLIYLWALQFISCNRSYRLELLYGTGPWSVIFFRRCLVSAWQLVSVTRNGKVAAELFQLWRSKAAKAVTNLFL